MNDHSKTKAKTKFDMPRHLKRHQLEVRLKVISTRDGVSTQFMGRTIDMSETGIGGTMAGDLTPGDIVTLQFSLPDSKEALNLRATVRHRFGFHYGFEFITLSDEQREAIRRVCGFFLHEEGSK